MFVSTTQVFTDSGWKKISDISGHDRVLVRNFLGDAELIQPFALKKRKYGGEVVKIGAKDWSFTVTPDHKNIDSTKIVRKFRYIFSDDPKKEWITVRDDFGRRSVTISPHDWYKLVGFMLQRGFIRMKPGRPMLWFFLDEDRVEEESKILGDILDRLGVGWHVQYSEKTRPKVVVSSKNTLASRLMNRLGSNKRKKMFLPDRMIYSSTKELSKLLIDTIISTSIQPNTKRRSVYQLSTTNKALMDSLTLLGTLNGYSIRTVLKAPAGTPTNKGVTKIDSYFLQISDINEVYSQKKIEKKKYSGYVYGIDLFDGQVYVKEESMPVWVSPK